MQDSAGSYSFYFVSDVDSRKASALGCAIVSVSKPLTTAAGNRTLYLKRLGERYSSALPVELNLNQEMCVRAFG